MIPQTTAPPSCRECGHVALVSITQGQRVERYDRCEHPTAPACWLLPSRCAPRLGRSWSSCTA